MSKKLDHLETGSNQVVGLIYGFLVTRFISIPLANTVDPNLLSIGVTLLFLILSYSRSYGFRRLFRYFEKKLENSHTDKKDELS